MPNAERNYRQLLETRLQNCIRRDSRAVVAKELPEDVNSHQCRVVPFVQYWLSVCSWILSSSALNKTVYLMVRVINRVHLESTLGSGIFYQSDRWVDKIERKRREGREKKEGRERGRQDRR